MENRKLYCHTFSGNLGCIISENPIPDGIYIAEYELSKTNKSFLNMPYEYLKLYKETVEKRFTSYTEFLITYKKELQLISENDFKYVINIQNFLDFLKTSKLQLTGESSSIVYLYYTGNRDIINSLISNYKSTVIEICKYLKKFNIHYNAESYYMLDINDKVNFFNRTEELLKEHEEISEYIDFDNLKEIKSIMGYNKENEGE